MQKAHLIGICGKAMAGLAVMLKEQGYEISGSDEGFYDPVYSYLKDRGIMFAPRHAKENIPKDASFIVIGKHAKLVPESNEEVAAAFASGIPIRSLPEALQELMQETDNIVVAGSFGKSSCTSIITWCLLAAEQDPSYLIGAVPFGFASAAHRGKDKTFVIEGDEYPSANWDKTSKFLYYRPRTILLTSGEHDHLNVFPTLQEYLEPFQKLVELLPADGLLVACKSGAHVMDTIVPHAKARVVTYGMDSSADWYPKNIAYGTETTFTLCNKDGAVTELVTSGLGEYNIENIVGCAAVLLEKGLVTPAQLAEGIRTFQGVSGRLDRKDARSTVAIYEGYGSSHAKMQSLFDALRLHFPGKRIIAVFEPHTFSWRNRAALSWYDHAFGAADTVLIFEPPTHGASTQDQLSLDEIVAKVAARHASVFPFHSKEEGLMLLGSVLQEDDLVLLITSGDLGGIIPEVSRLAEKKFPLQLLPELTYIDEHGLLGSNFYWHKHDAKGISREEIMAIGLTDGRVQVSTKIIEPLKKVNAMFNAQGFRLYIKEGYRSKELYELVFKKRSEKFGVEETKRLFNMEGMPHAKGTSVDIALWHLDEDKEVFMRNGADGTDALFVDYYKTKNDEKSKEYQNLQEFVITTMLAEGFSLGTKNEYFHFDYKDK